MLKRSLTVLGVLLVVTSLVWSATVSRAQTATTIAFPASAVIRGENVWLRAAPALQTNVLALLQRGNAITITGAPTLADGDEFYPIQVTATGQSGWVRVLFIDPRSIVPIAAPPAAATLPPAAPTAVPPVTTPEPTQEAGGGNNKNKNKNKNQDQNQAQDQNQNNKKNKQNNAQEPTPVPAATVPPAPPAPAPTATPVPAVPATPPPANPPAETPPPSPGAITYTGTGTTTSQPFTLQPGRYRATASMEVSQPTGFTAILRGPDNSEQQVFDESIDTPQSWTATAAVRIDTAGDYYFDVTNTTDAWTIVLEPRQ